jgi:hypothetical protein
VRLHHASVRKPGPARPLFMLACNTTFDYSQIQVHLIMQKKIRWSLSRVVITRYHFYEKWTRYRDSGACMDIAERAV